MRSKVLKPIFIFLLLLFILSALVIVIIQTHYFRQFVKITTNAIVSTLTAQNFTIGSIEGNLLEGITLKNVSFAIGSEKFIDCDEIYIDYSLPLLLDGSMFFSKEVPLHEVRVTGLRVNLVHYKNGNWNFQELQKLIIKGKRPNPHWNIFIKNAVVSGAKMTIEDERTGQSSIFELTDADFSLNMFNVADRAEIFLRSAHLTAAYESMDFEKLYFDNITGEAVYSNKERPDRFDVNRVVFNYMGATVTGTGAIIDMINPRFTLSGLIHNIDIPDIGILDLKVDAHGNSLMWNDLHASGGVKLADSKLMDTSLSGGIESVSVENTHVVLNKGSLAAEFGEASFNGTLDLFEMKDRHKKNVLDLQLNLSSLKVPGLLEMVMKRDASIKEALNMNIEAAINSRLELTAGWSRTQELTTVLDMRELDLTGGGLGEIRLKGPVSIDPSNIDYDIDASFTNTNFGALLKDQKYASEFNSTLKAKGSLKTRGNTPQNIETALRGEVRPSRVFGIQLKHGLVDAAYDGASLDIKSLVVESEPFVVNASGHLGKAGGDGVKYNIDIKDLGILSKLAPGFHFGGSLGLNGYLKGDLKNPGVVVNAGGSDFVYEEKGLRLKKYGLKAAGALNIDNPGLSANGEIKGIEIGGRDFQVVGFNAESRGGQIYGSLHIQETAQKNYSLDYKLTELGKEEKKLELDKLIFHFKNAVLQNRQPILISFFKDKVKVSSLNLYHKDNFLVGDFSIGFDQSIDGSIKLEKLSLLDASELLDVQFPVKGRMSGEIKFGSSMRHPDVMADIMAKNLEYMNFKSDDLTLSLIFSDDKIGLKLKISDKKEEVLSAVAEARINFDPEHMDKSINEAFYKATIKSKGVDISPIAALNDEIHEISGKLMIDVVAEGSGKNPNVSGSLKLKDMSMKIKSMRNKIQIDDAVMYMKGQYGTLSPVTIKTGGGEGVFEGSIDFRDLSYMGKGKMTSMLVKTYPAEVTANLDGDIEVSGKFLNTSIKGNITANKLRIKVPDKPLKEIESIKFIDEKGPDQEEFIFKGEKREDYVEEYMALDLDLDIPKDSWVKGAGANIGANIEVEGKLRIKKDFKEPYVVIGNIDVVRGDYQFMGKLFKIENGTVSFGGKETIDPFLDLRATYEVSSVEIYINVTGTAEKPKIQLSSNPPLGENEIVSYLVFSTSPDQLGTDQRVQFQEKAGEVLGTMAVGELREAIGNDLAIDVMTIKGGQTGFRDTHVEIGKYLTEKLYIGYERLAYERYFYERYFFSPGIPSSTITANRAVIQYRLFDFLTLESEIGEQAGADLFFNFDY
ncbi:MAG: translocation/assembly module TamB domain-containing protein [Thermodesulfobacteriota bacterium]